MVFEGYRHVLNHDFGNKTFSRCLPWTIVALALKCCGMQSLTLSLRCPYDMLCWLSNHDCVWNDTFALSASFRCCKTERYVV